jgi:hypothetical protein
MYIKPVRKQSYTVLVQPNIDEDGNLQPMVIDSKGRIIVDSYGYIQSLKACPSGVNCVGQKTQTSGIQEALNYIISIGGGRVLVKYGTYTVNQQITVSPQNEVYIDLVGEGRPTIIGNTGAGSNISPVLGVALNPSTTTANDSWFMLRNFKFLNQNVGQPAIGLNGGNPGASPPTNIRIGSVVIENVIIEDASTQSYSADKLWINRFRNAYVRNVEIYAVNGVFGIEVNSVRNLKINNSIITGVQAAINVYSDYLNDNVSIENIIAEADYQNGASGGIISYYPTSPTYFQLRSLSIKNAIIRSGTSSYNVDGINVPTQGAPSYLVNCNIENVTFEGQMRSAVSVYGGVNMNAKNLIILQNSTGYPSEALRFHIDVQTNMNVNVEGINVNTAGSLITAHLTMDSNSTGPFNINVKDYILYQNVPILQVLFTPYQSGTVPFRSLMKLKGVAELTLNTAYFNNLYSQLYSQYPSGTSSPVAILSPNYSATRPNTSITIYDYVPQPSTPSIPASGSAYQNLNPYPVEVYLSGGSATEVQVTRNGTTYIVWSSSTAAAIPPLTVRLDPGDSITLTYSTAPSWTWLPV